MSMIREFTVAQVRAMPYPDLFEKELRACAIYQDDSIIRVDAQSCYHALQKKYGGKELSEVEQLRIRENRKLLTNVTLNGKIVKTTIAPGDIPTNNQVQSIAQEQKIQIEQKLANPPATPKVQPIATRPEISLKNLMSVAAALLFGDGVTTDRRKARLDICRQCELMVYDEKNGVARCGICGCKLAGKENLVDLLRFEETEQYGCKHPNGSKWKQHGV